MGSVESIAHLIIDLYFAYDKLDSYHFSLNLYQDNSVFESIYNWGISLLHSNTIFIALTIYKWLLSIIAIISDRSLTFNMLSSIQFILFFIYISELDLISSSYVSIQEFILVLISIFKSRNPRTNFKNFCILIFSLSFISSIFPKISKHDTLQLLYNYFLLNLWAIPLYFILFFSHVLIISIEDSFNNTFYNLPENIGNKLLFLIYHQEKIYSANTFFGSLFLITFVFPELFFQISTAVYPSCLILIHYFVMYLYSLPVAVMMSLFSVRFEHSITFINAWAVLFSLVIYREALYYLFDIDFIEYKRIFLG